MQKYYKILLISLFIFAFIIRCLGISYGLPLWIINDEPSTILGSLKMMELRSVIPAFHQKEMASVLYYPPYISYVYIIPFSIIYGIQLLLHMSLQDILLDLSPYFIVARIISIFVGILSIWFMYKTSETITQSKKAALFSVFLASTSLIHISLSFSARHWIFICLIYSLAFYLLFNKRSYIYFSIVVALGMGVSSISALLFALLPLHYFIIERKSLASALKNSKFWFIAALTGCLSILPSLLYPKSNGFIVDITTQSTKSLLGLILSPINFLQFITFSEPVVILLLVLGLFYLYKKEKKVTLILFSFIYFYSIVYYVMFRFESRFLLAVLPLIFILGGYACDMLYKKNKWFIIILCIPLIGSLKLGQLALLNDSRIHAVNWVEQNIEKNTKVIVHGSQLRIPSTKEAVQELRSIDSGAIRRIDTAEENTGVGELHSLNIYTVKDEDFFKNLPLFAKNNKYTILVREYGRSDFHNYVSKIINTNSEILNTFGTDNISHSIAISDFSGSLMTLFKTKMLGPQIDIYKLQ